MRKPETFAMLRPHHQAANEGQINDQARLQLMSEEHGPADLVRYAVRDEEAGFDFAAISDHFTPWLVEQGHSPLAWPVCFSIEPGPPSNSN
jgi:alkanesulfonate monooxygenase SsuD/methylene tetrahydromethanopterin reductase-like flavin-dependent oxidoreductase (luciferase family)